MPEAGKRILDYVAKCPGTELASPERATLFYRQFVRRAVRHCVLEVKGFRTEEVRDMAAEAGIPEADRDHVVDYVGREFHSLHEGNAVRYRLRREDLAAIGAAQSVRRP